MTIDVKDLDEIKKNYRGIVQVCVYESQNNNMTMLCASTLKI